MHPSPEPPETLGPAPVKDVRQEEIFRASLFIGPTVTLAYALLYGLMGNMYLALVCGFGTLSFIVVALLAPIYGATRTIRNFNVFIAAVVIMCTSQEVGGLGDISAAWHLMVPLLAYLVIDGQGFRWWTLLYGLCVVGLAAAGLAGMEPNYFVPVEQRPLYEAFSFLTFFATALLFVLEAVRHGEQVERALLELNETLTDEVAERIEAEQRAVAAANERGAFLANMSHEIRTPLHGMLGMTDLLVNSDLTPTCQSYAETAKSSGEHLLVLLNDILDLSKIEADAVHLEEVPVDLEDIFAHCCEVVIQSPAASAIQVLLDSNLEGREWISGDGTRLQQVFLNLMTNAVKFTEEGSVYLRAHWNDGLLCVRVEDTGIGITPAQQADLFEPFRQADNSTTRKYGGTGLGLAIVARLVEAMGGTIEISSEQGVGTCFTVQLALTQLTDHAPAAPIVQEDIGVFVPDDAEREEVLRAIRGRVARVVVVRCREDASDCTVLIVRGSSDDVERSSKWGLPMVLLHNGQSAVQPTFEQPVRILAAPARSRTVLAAIEALVSDDPTEERASLHQFAGRHALVVDDNAINRIVAKAMLIRLGLDVELAASGAEALACCATSEFDIILMDCQMPDMDGYETTQALLSGDDPVTTPIVALTASMQKADQIRAMDAGMVDYVGKPLPIETLVEVLKRWVPELNRDQKRSLEMEDALGGP